MPLEEVPQPPVREPATCRHPPFGLLELVPVVRVVQKVREIREELEAVAEEESRGANRRGASRALNLGRKTLAVRPAAVSRIDEPETGRQPARNRARRHLVGGVPVCPVPHAGQDESVAIVAAAEAQHAVDLAVPIGSDPRSVVLVQLDGAEQTAVAHARRCSTEHPAPSVAAIAHPNQRLVKVTDVVDIGGAGRREIPFFGVVRPFLELHAADELRDQEPEVGVAMRVGAGRHVDRHARDRGREVGAVIEIEPAQIVLVGLSLAAVLADNHAGHRLEHLAGAHDGSFLQLRGRDGSLAGSRGDADEVFGPVLDLGNAAERPRAGDDDVGAQRKRHHNVDGGRASLCDGDGAPHDSEVEESKGQLGGPCRHRCEAVGTGRVGHGRLLGESRHEIDRDARKHRAGLIEGPAADAACLLALGRRGRGQKRDQSEH